MLEHWIETPISPAFIRVRGGAPVELVSVTEPAVTLPPGMSVDGVRLVCLRFTRGVSEHDSVVVESGAKQSGGAESGEYLESIGSETPLGLMSVAMRDCEWLAGDGIVGDWARYADDHIAQPISKAPYNAVVWVSLAWHIRGEAALEGEDVFTWYAADIALPWR